MSSKSRSSTVTCDDVLGDVQRLTPTDQLRLLKRLAIIVRGQVKDERPRNILELRGLGKEIWQGVDVQDYIDQERASWNG